MTPIVLFALLSIHLGPMGPDAPAREPQIAANSSMVVLAFGAGQSIYFSSSRDGGASFSEPAKVVDAGILPLSRHRGPRIALAGKTIVITAVAGKKPEEGAHAHGLPSDGDLLVWRSQDGGKTWSRGKAINDVPASATEGLHTLASDGKGMLFAAWLDKRGAKGTKLYSSRSTDGGPILLSSPSIVRQSLKIREERPSTLEEKSAKMVIYLTQVDTTCSIAGYGRISAEPERV